VEIQFGEGGDDSKTFVHELLATYCKYAERCCLTFELLGSTNGHVVVRFAGKNVWKAFQHESGKHCVQRFPPSEKKGRRHTSMISVAVLPLPPKLALSSLPNDELEVKTQGGSGPGGQHQNKTDSAVRMTHKPTGLQVFINGRDQQRNRREALRILTAKVCERLQSQQAAAYDAKRKSQMGSGGRGDKIRTYNFIDSRVVDHRLGKKTKQIKRVMKGELDLLLD
jgi:peptide chain release factor 1